MELNRTDILSSLANAEIYLTIAILIRQFDFSLYQTTDKDIAFARDFGAPYPEEGNHTMKVLVESLA